MLGAGIEKAAFSQGLSALRYVFSDCTRRLSEAVVLILHLSRRIRAQHCLSAHPLVRANEEMYLYPLVFVELPFWLHRDTAIYPQCGGNAVIHQEQVNNSKVKL